LLNGERGRRRKRRAANLGAQTWGKLQNKKRTHRGSRPRQKATLSEEREEGRKPHRASKKNKRDSRRAGNAPWPADPDGREHKERGEGASGLRRLLSLHRKKNEKNLPTPGETNAGDRNRRRARILGGKGKESSKYLGFIRGEN